MKLVLEHRVLQLRIQIFVLYYETLIFEDVLGKSALADLGG